MLPEVWLSPLAVLLYIIYFWFYGWYHVFPYLAVIGQEKATCIGYIFKVTHQRAAHWAKFDFYNCLV